MFVYYLYITKYFVHIVITRLYEIFPQEQYDVNVYLKNQNDVAPKAMRYDHNLLYIPQLITISLLRILELRNEMNIDDVYLYKALNGGFEVSDEKYAQISNIMLEINENNWESLKQVTDVIIIAEMLFIWMDECVRYCISPNSIAEIFKDEGGDECSNNITEQLLDHNNQTKEEQQLLNLFIKKHMKKYEYEILKYYALFLKEISPTTMSFHDNQSVISEYEHMTEKIAIFLLGYNIDTLFEKEYQITSKASIDDTGNANIFDTVQNLIILLEFFQNLSKYTLSEENKYNQLNEEVTKHLNKNKMMSSHWSVDRSPVFDNSNNAILGQKGIFNLNYNRNVNSTLKKVNSKEKKLYDIYAMLKEHFKGKDEHRYTRQTETDLRKRIDTLAKEIKQSSRDNVVSEEDDRESSSDNNNNNNNKNDMSITKSNQHTEDNNNIVERESIANKIHFPSDEIRQIKRNSINIHLTDNANVKCASVDWFNMKRKSKGIFVLDKKRATGALQYRFSLRRNNIAWNKPRMNNNSDVNEIMRKQGLFPKLRHNKKMFLTNDSAIPEVLEHNTSNVLKLNHNHDNMMIKNFSIIPHSCSDI